MNIQLIYSINTYLLSGYCFRHRAKSNTNGQEIHEQMVIYLNHSEKNASENQGNYSIFHPSNGLHI